MEMILMSVFKPINVLFDDRVTDLQKSAVKDAIEELLEIAGVKHIIPIRYFDAWRDKNCEDGNGRLLPYLSVEWYILNAYENRQNHAGDDQINAEIILESFAQEKWQKIEAHYDIFVTSFDLYADGCNWVIGGAREGLGMAMSTWRWQNFSEIEQYEILKTETIHELCHVFGLTERYGSHLKGIYHGHCLNECVMRQGVTTEEFRKYTVDRLKSRKPLCNQCQKEILMYFRKE